MLQTYIRNMIRTFAAAGLAIFLSGAAFSQSAAKLSFDAADIQVSKAPDQGPSADFKPGGRAELRNASLKKMIFEAYGVPENMVIGGPSWLDSDHFDIVAKADPKSTIPELLRMLQTLLVERFKLKIHWDRKVVPVYALVVGKGGPKLKESAAGDGKRNCQRRAVAGATPGWAELTCTNMTMADLAELLPETAPAYVDLPAVDLTGLKGAYDLKLTWTGRYFLEGTKRDDQGNLLPAAGGFSIFDELQKDLGLKLEQRKLPRPTVVVDSVERTPTDN